MWAKTFIVASVGLAVLGMSGCSGCDGATYYPGYCDTTGCYACNGPNECWQVSHPACGTDLECAANEKCTDIGCALPCTSDAQCVNGEVCDGTTDFCAPPGVTPNVIDPNTNNTHNTVPVPESCTTDEECQRANPALVCDNGKCIDACTSDADCPADYVCAPCGKCTPKDTPTCGDARNYCDATQATSCGPNRACLTGHCHLTCDGQSPCPIGQVCTSGVCVDDPAPVSPQCTYNAQCSALGMSAVCVNGYCHPTCTADNQCGLAEFCSTGGGAQGVCMPDYRPAQ
ncbi:MAG TPA: hypothetical protein VGQ83_23455 [Polyangia bacterium]|jgi:hypothetical protein